jgi:hypothetical protein
MRIKVEKKHLSTALPEKCFWVHYGPIVGSLSELLRALKEDIHDEQFLYHVNKGKNDFAVWIKEVLHDESCAKKFNRAKTRTTAIKIITECLEGYE